MMTKNTHIHKECPKCHRLSVAYDTYFRRHVCRFRDCGWMETPEEYTLSQDAMERLGRTFKTEEERYRKYVDGKWDKTKTELQPKVTTEPESSDPDTT